MSDNTEQRRLAAIMFTDMVGFSALSQQNESLALELLRENQNMLRALFPLYDGREVKNTGDGFLVEFTSALQASQCAVEIQTSVSARNASQPSERQFFVRIGIHVGDVVYREPDIYGDGVNIAARIEPLAVGGGICLSDTVYSQVHNKLGTGFVKLNSPELKNIGAAMDVYRVVLPWDKPTSEPGSAQTEVGVQRQNEFAPKRIMFAGIAALLVLVVGLAWWYATAPGEATGKNATSPATLGDVAAPDQKSVAVLPFVNMSADKTDEYLSDGMTEELLHKLAQVPGLRVPGRTSCFSFKGKTGDDIFRQVGEKLDVTTVLEGSVRKVGNKLRITAQLINVSDGFHLWSKTYDGDMQDILSFQSNVAQQVVQVLQLKLGAEATRELAKASTTNPEAHRLYLLGRHHFGINTEASLRKAMQCFNEALKKDPTYALAYCGLSDCYGWLGGGPFTSKEAWAKGKEMSLRALELDPNLADAHLSLGIALASAYDWNGGERHMKRALELNPKLAFAYDQLAWLQSNLGRFEEAISNGLEAIELDPLSLLINTNYGDYLSLARRYDEAIAQLRKTLDMDPNYAGANFELGWCLLENGDTANAIAAFQKAKALDLQPYFASTLAYAYARAGDRTEAEQMLRDLKQSKRKSSSPGTHMLLYLGLGEKDRALDWLERCYEEQHGFCWGLRVNPIFDPLRTEPRFQALLKKVGLDR